MALIAAKEVEGSWPEEATAWLEGVRGRMGMALMRS